ncbi:hypothetical protein TELCIR_05655, partial [Teladorsagia circumcincta]
MDFRNFERDPPGYPSGLKLSEFKRRARRILTWELLFGARIYANLSNSITIRKQAVSTDESATNETKLPSTDFSNQKALEICLIDEQIPKKNFQFPKRHCNGFEGSTYREPSNWERLPLTSRDVAPGGDDLSLTGRRKGGIAEYEKISYLISLQICGLADKLDLEEVKATTTLYPPWTETAFCQGTLSNGDRNFGERWMLNKRERREPQKRGEATQKESENDGERQATSPSRPPPSMEQVLGPGVRAYPGMNQGRRLIRLALEVATATLRKFAVVNTTSISPRAEIVLEHPENLKNCKVRHALDIVANCNELIESDLQLHLISCYETEMRCNVSVIHPVHIIVPLPLEDDTEELKNPFGLTILKVRPVIDLALDDAYRKFQYVPPDSMAVTYRDSRLSDAHGPNVAIQQLVKGIPVISPIGLTMNLDDKTEYQTLTRISGPYK